MELTLAIWFWYASPRVYSKGVTILLLLVTISLEVALLPAVAAFDVVVGAPVGPIIVK
jgi:hypothetical protein